MRSFLSLCQFANDCPTASSGFDPNGLPASG